MPGAAKPRRNMKGVGVILFGIALIGAVIGGGVWYLLPKTNTPATPAAPGSAASPGTPQPQAAPINIPPPSPLFSTDTSKTITIPAQDHSAFLKLVADVLHAPEPQKTIKRILIKLQNRQNDHYASLAEFFDLWRITPPQNFLQHLDPAFMFFVSYGSDGPRVGFATKTRDRDRTLSAIFMWEQSMISDFAPFFSQEQLTQPDSPFFEDRTSSNTDWRYLKLSTQKDLGIGYMIFQANNLVVFATSKASMHSIIKTLYGIQ